MVFSEKKYKLTKYKHGIYRLVEKQTDRIVPNIIGKRHKTIAHAEEEASILERIKHIRGVPQLLDRVGRCLILTEIKGTDLFEIAKNHKFNEQEIKSIVYSLALIIKDLHKVGVIHRDLKLENIIYDNETKEIGLIDFDQKITKEYLPPECVDNGWCSPATPACDIWGIGTVCYLLVERCYAFNTISQIKKRPFRRIKSNVSSQCINFITSCLEKDPDKRPGIDTILQCEWFD